MRGQYLTLTCLLSMISGLAVTSETVVNNNSGLTIWLLFSIFSGMILNLPVFYPKPLEIIRESIVVSGFYCFTILGRTYYEILLKLFFDPSGSHLLCFKDYCKNVPIKEILKSPLFLSDIQISLLLLSFIFITSSVAIIISTFSGKLLLKYTKQFFELDPNVFEIWKKIVIGALSFGGIIFTTVKLLD